MSYFVRAGGKLVTQVETYEGAGGQMNRTRPTRTKDQHSHSVAHVDSHVLLLGQPNVCELGNVFGSLHVRGIAASAEDYSDTGRRVDIVGGDESTGRVVDQGSEFGANSLYRQPSFVSRNPRISQETQRTSCPHRGLQHSERRNPWSSESALVVSIFFAASTHLRGQYASGSKGRRTRHSVDDQRRHSL